jgi:hypothetical protein
MEKTAIIIILLNLAFLVRYSIQDIKTHTIPKSATFAYVAASLLLSNLVFIFQGIVICIALYLITRSVYIATGDRKLIFGLTLQYGGILGLGIMGSLVLVLAIKGMFAKGRTTKPMALIPIILGVYILWIVYMILNLNLA